GDDLPGAEAGAPCRRRHGATLPVVRQRGRARPCGGRAASRIGPRTGRHTHRDNLKGSDMDAWEFHDLEAARAASGRPYHEFKRVPDLSAGIYTLDAGATDGPQPHTQDQRHYDVP